MRGIAPRLAGFGALELLEVDRHLRRKQAQHFVLERRIAQREARQVAAIDRILA